MNNWIDISIFCLICLNLAASVARLVDTIRSRRRTKRLVASLKQQIGALVYELCPELNEVNTELEHLLDKAGDTNIDGGVAVETALNDINETLRKLAERHDQILADNPWIGDLDKTLDQL